MARSHSHTVSICSNLSTVYSQRASLYVSSHCNQVFQSLISVDVTKQPHFVFGIHRIALIRRKKVRFQLMHSLAVIPTQQYCFQQYDHAENWMECPPVTGTTTVKASCRQIVMLRSASFISNGVVCKHSLHCRLGLDRMR